MAAESKKLCGHVSAVFALFLISAVECCQTVPQAAEARGMSRTVHIHNKEASEEPWVWLGLALGAGGGHMAGARGRREVRCDAQA